MSRIFKSIAPIALSVLAPGLGTAIGSALGAGAAFAPIVGNAALGAGIGAIGGGGLKSAGVGALGGAAFGAAPALGAASGLGKAGSAAITKGIQGAALGLSGGTEGAISGALLGGAGGYLGAGGKVPVLGSVGGRLGAGGMGPPTPGSGILGKLTSLTGASTGGQPMKLGSLLQAGGDIYGYMQGKNDIDEMRKLLEAQAGRAEAQFQPYSQAGQQALANMQAPSLEALQNDPGYQFRLQQGQQALERSLAARGLGQSGAALKAAQEYGQGLADQTYNDYFARQGQLADLGYGAASGLGSLYENLGNVQAAAELERMNSRNNLISSLTGSQGLIRGLGGLFGYA